MLKFEYKFAKEDPTDYSTQIFNNRNLPNLYAPDDGAYISGMYLEGATWDFEKYRLVESQAKILHTKAPIILLKPSIVKVKNTTIVALKHAVEEEQKQMNEKQRSGQLSPEDSISKTPAPEAQEDSDESGEGD